MSGNVRFVDGAWRFFHEPSWQWRELKDPHGPPTARQLLRLWHIRALQLDGKPRFDKLDAARAINEVDG